MVEFEQLVLSSPSSSLVWIQYMAFLLGLGEMAEARKTAERALKTINYRWVAGDRL